MTDKPIRMPRKVAVPLMILCAALSFWMGYWRAMLRYGAPDFRAVYYGTRCLLQHHNPYNIGDLERVVRTEHGERPSETVDQHQAVTLYVNLPSTFLVVAPFAVLPLFTAKLLWLASLTVLLLLASFLMWREAESYAPVTSLVLTCLVLANSFVVFSGGNTAGIAVPLCIIATWCFLGDRFVPAGIVCMALSLAIKPHDSGFIWLYFILIGGINRKRALQSLLGTAVLFLLGATWVSMVAPGWIQNWRTNLAVIATHGHINDPGPASIVGFSNISPVIDLQTVVSIFRDDPRFYNPITYIICGLLLGGWAILTLKSRYSTERALLALAAVAPLTMLITYHRPWDAKLLLIAIPGCAMLQTNACTKHSRALLITFAALACVGDLTMTFGLAFSDAIDALWPGFYARTLIGIFARPIPIILMGTGAFYLHAYFQSVFRQSDRNSEECSSRKHLSPVET